MDKMQELKELYGKYKINWTKFYTSFDDHQQHPEAQFDVTPIEYLKFAKSNLEINSNQSCIDSIGNIKRAIEAQTDLLITALGYDYKIFDNGDKYKKTKEFISKHYKEGDIAGITNRLKLLNLLGMAPSLLISSIRNLRNRMEHEYIIPTYEEVRRAIEVAELYIYSSTYKFSWTFTVVEISNNDFKVILPQETMPLMRLIFRSYDEKMCRVELIYSLEEKYRIILEPEDKEYIHIIFCLFNEDCSVLPEIFGCEIEKQYVKWE